MTNVDWAGGVKSLREGFQEETVRETSRARGGAFLPVAFLTKPGEYLIRVWMDWTGIKPRIIRGLQESQHRGSRALPA